MDRFVKSCEQFEEYPRNIIEPEATYRSLKSISQRLHDAKHNLFCDNSINPSRQTERRSVVDFIDVDGGRGEYGL